jgi:hypothetical protein
MTRDTAGSWGEDEPRRDGTIERVSVGDDVVVFAPPLAYTLERDGGEWVASVEAPFGHWLAGMSSGGSQADAVADLVDTIGFVWVEYAEWPDDGLTEQAQRLAATLRARGTRHVGGGR